MSWSRSGTVACTQNSTTVTGTGADFAANGLVGDAFLGPDGRIYEVVNIASATALSILPAYQGPTVSAGSYALAPVQGYTRDSAIQLRVLLNKFGTLAAAPAINALSAVTGGSNKIAYFTAADQMALADFTAQARTLLAATTQANQRTALGLGSAAVAALLGAVSQSGGVPTGAAMQVISNANGIALKFANGMMICTGTAGGTTSNGSANITLVNFADTFAESPKVATTLTTSLPSRFSSTAYSVSTTQIGIAIGDNAGGGAAVTVGYIAIGRWFV